MSPGVPFNNTFNPLYLGQPASGYHKCKIASREGRVSPVDYANFSNSTRLQLIEII